MSVFQKLGHPSVADYVTKARTAHSVSPHDVSGSRSPDDLGISITLPGATGGLGGGIGHPSAPDPTTSLYPNQLGIGTEGYQPRNFVENTFNPRLTSGHPSAPNKYSPSGYGGTRGLGAGGVTEPDPVLPPGPGPGYYGQTPMSGNNQWIPENPMSPASTYGQLPGAGPSIYGGPNNADGQVLDPLGVGAGPSNQFSPLNAAIGDVLDPVGIGAGPSDMYGTAPNRGGPGSGADGYGAGPGMYGQTPEQGEDSVPYNLIEGTPSIGEGMNQLGIGGTRTTDPTTGEESVNAQNPETAVANYEVEKKLRDDLIADREARWGEASNKDEQEQFLKDMEKTMRTQMLLEGLAAWSGNAGAASMAQSWGQNSMALLEQKYNFAQDDRIANMSKALMYDENGNADSPKTREELYKAMDVMGASAAEREYFDGLMFGDGTAREDNTYRNFINTRTGETYSGYGPKDESGDWAITGQYDYGTKDGKTPGGVDMEKYVIWQEAKKNNTEGTMSDQQLADLEKALGFEQKDIKLNQEFSMFESIYKDSRMGWKLPGMKAGQIPTAKQIEEGFKKFQKDVLPILKGTAEDVADVVASYDTAEEAKAALDRGELKVGDRVEINGKVRQVKES